MISESTFTSLINQSFNSVAGNSTNGKAKRLSETLENNLNFRVHEKTLTRYYKQYVDATEAKRTPDVEIVNMLCKNLGYLNIKSYENSIKPERRKKVNIKRNWILGILVSVVIVFSVYKYTNLKAAKCMTWKEKTYMYCNCDNNVHEQTGNVILRITEANKQLLSLKKLNVNPETVFFKNGQPQVWYGKNYNGRLEYFNMLTVHPETGETLKKITPYMINTHVLEN